MLIIIFATILLILSILQLNGYSVEIYLAIFGIINFINIILNYIIININVDRQDRTYIEKQSKILNKALKEEKQKTKKNK